MPYKFSEKLTQYKDKIMDIGNFMPDWNKQAFPECYCYWVYYDFRSLTKPITDKNLLLCVDRDNLVFRLYSSDIFWLYAQRQIEIPRSAKLNELLTDEMELSIRELFSSLADFPRKQEFQLSDTKVLALSDSQIYSAIIKYGDPLKLGGYKKIVKGFFEDIRKEAWQCEDQMFREMGCNGNPFVTISIGDRNYNKNGERIPPHKFTGKWFKDNVHSLSKPYIDSMADQVFGGCSDASSISYISLKDLLSCIYDGQLYSSYTPNELRTKYFAWRRFVVN